MLSFFKKKSKQTNTVKKSIYSCILENINNDGVLPPDFMLPDDSNENQIRFAAGAMDGIGIYHMAGSDMSMVGEKFMLLKGLYRKLKRKKIGFLSMAVAIA